MAAHICDIGHRVQNEAAAALRARLLRQGQRASEQVVSGTVPRYKTECTQHDALHPGVGRRFKLCQQRLCLRRLAGFEQPSRLGQDKHATATAQLGRFT